VPECTLSSGIPSDVLPKDPVSAEIWLKAIGRNDMISKFSTIFLDNLCTIRKFLHIEVIDCRLSIINQ